MREGRYAGNARPGNAQGHESYDEQIGYDEPRSAGFTRYSGRGEARRRPVGRSNRNGGNVIGRIGDAVGGLVRRRGSSSRDVERGVRAPSREAMDNGDYLGTGMPCRVCGNPVDNTQARCPHCGAFVRPLYQQVPFWIAIVVLIALVVVLAVVINSCSSSEDGGTAPTASQNTDALSSAVASAQEAIDGQAVDRTVTRYSLQTLREALAQANDIMAEGEAVTDEQIAAAVQSVNSAISGLTPLAESYPWPTYEELTTPVDAMVGQQVAVSGTYQAAAVGDDGSVMSSMALSGDANCIVYVQYTSAETATELTEGDDFTAYGTVVGSEGGVPIIWADRVEVA